VKRVSESTSAEKKTWLGKNAVSAVATSPVRRPASALPSRQTKPHVSAPKTAFMTTAVAGPAPASR
jgi:hypothetical protein